MTSFWRCAWREGLKIHHTEDYDDEDTANARGDELRRRGHLVLVYSIPILEESA